MSHSADRVAEASSPAPDTANARAQALIDGLERAAVAGTVAAAAQRGAAIAQLVTQLHAEDELVAAARVYPLAQAGAIDSTLIAERVGKATARLVEGLVKLGRFHLPHNWDGASALSPDHAETVRHMVLAMAAEVRLVLVRLAEQLELLRSLKRAPDSERRQPSRETQIVFAPLANRLGVWQLKWELEDLAFRYLEPDTYRRLAAALRERRTDREEYIAAVRKRLVSELAAVGIEAEITGRPKHIYSIWRKMKRKEVGLEQLFDIRAVRILVGSVADCYAALGVVHGIWHYIPGEFDDYIATPKENDYQSIHTAVIGPEGLPLEVQIRTYEMHEHAELGVAAHWRYKEGNRSQRNLDERIRWLRQLLIPDSGHETPSDFIDRVRSEILEDRVYVISPKGDVVDLPRGATPLDFAYHVHTDVGNHCRGAKVNGRMVPLTYKLHNGEQVEIITAKSAHPSRDWLIPQQGYLASPRSRTKVRAWFRHQDQEQNRKHGRAMLDRELGRLGLRDLSMPRLLRALRVGNADELHLGLGSGDISLAAVTHALARELAPERERPPPNRATPAVRPGRGSPVTVEGVGEMMSNFARCCRPVPPEPISGYVTLGRGVSIHRKSCRNLLRLREVQRERVLEVQWSEGGKDAVHPVELRVDAYDRQGLTRDITAVMADAKISILSMTVRTDPAHNTAALRMTIGVTSLDELSRILNRLTTLPNVVHAERVV